MQGCQTIIPDRFTIRPPSTMHNEPTTESIPNQYVRRLRCSNKAIFPYSGGAIHTELRIPPGAAVGSLQTDPAAVGLFRGHPIWDNECIPGKVIIRFWSPRQLTGALQ